MRKEIIQFDECKPKKRGRSLNTSNIDQKKQEKQGNICSQVAYKGTDKEKTNYYRTSKGVSAQKSAKKSKLKRKLDARKKKAEDKKKKQESKKSRMLEMAKGIDKETVKGVESGKIKTFKRINELRMKMKLKKEMQKEQGSKNKGVSNSLEKENARLKDNLERGEIRESILKDKINKLRKELKELKESKEVEKPKEKLKDNNNTDKKQGTPIKDFSQKYINNIIREIYERGYYQHRGILNLANLQDAMKKYGIETTGKDKQDFDKTILNLRNQGLIKLAEAIDLNNLKEEDIIRDFRKNYFAIKIDDLIEF